MSTTHYAVISPGWGSESIGKYNGVSIDYEGESLKEARRVLAKEQAAVRRLREQPQFRNASDTCLIIQFGPNDTGWHPLD